MSQVEPTIKPSSGVRLSPEALQHLDEDYEALRKRVYTA